MRVPTPVWIALAGIVLAMLPFFRPPAFYESFLYLIFLWVVLATSWNILSGYSGYFSFGHGAFFGAGMYTSATLTSMFGVPFLLSLPVAGLVTAALGMGIGAIAFRMRRLRGELFALLTLAVTFVFATIALNTPIDGGPGVYLSGVRIPKLFPSLSSTFYLLALVLAAVTVWIAYAVYRSRLGAGLFAIHDDEDTAETVGVPTFRYKITAFGISCALAGVAGGIHALFVSYVTVGETFSILVPLSVVLMSVLGGTRHWFGPAVGAAVVTALLYFFTAGNYPVAGRAAMGVIFVVVVLFLPDGLLGRFTRPGRKKGDAGDASVPAVAATDIRHRTPQPGTAPLLTIRGLGKSFSGLRAVDGVDLDVMRGEILCLVGPNGSGKSTLINLVSGHYRPDSGQIVFGGRNIAGFDAHGIRHAGIARTYQIPRPFAHLTVLQNTALPARFGQDWMDREAAEREARHWLDFTGLAVKADALPSDLNLHQLKFLELARALVSRPALLMLDEVLSGLTPAEIDKAIGTVRAIRDQGTTIVFVEHVMRAVMELADRIVVLNQGKVIAVGDPHEVTRRPEVVTAYLGKPHA